MDWLVHTRNVHTVKCTLKKNSYCSTLIQCQLSYPLRSLTKYMTCDIGGIKVGGDSSQYITPVVKVIIMLSV